MKLKEITPQHFICVGGGCPAIFDITPEAFQCVGGGCPGVFEEGKKLLIIGRKVEDLKKLGLAKRVGKDEEAIIINREMLRQVLK